MSQAEKNLVGSIKTYSNQYGAYQILWLSSAHLQQLIDANNQAQGAGVSVAIKLSQKNNLYCEILPPRPPQQGQPGPYPTAPAVHNPVPQQGQPAPGYYPPQPGFPQAPAQGYPVQQPQPGFTQQQPAQPHFPQAPQQPAPQAFPQAPMTGAPAGDPFNRG